MDTQGIITPSAAANYSRPVPVRIKAIALVTDHDADVRRTVRRVQVLEHAVEGSAWAYTGRKRFWIS